MREHRGPPASEHNHDGRLIEILNELIGYLKHDHARAVACLHSFDPLRSDIMALSQNVQDLTGGVTALTTAVSSLHDRIPNSDEDDVAIGNATRTIASAVDQLNAIFPAPPAAPPAP